MNTNEEKQKLEALKKQGYIIEVADPTATEFNQKYSVYRDMPPLGKRYVLLNASGDIIGHQG